MVLMIQVSNQKLLWISMFDCISNCRPFKRPALSGQQRKEPQLELDPDDIEPDPEERQSPGKTCDVRQATKLRGAKARRWFAKLHMLPEWRIDIPSNLNTDWYVFARPAGKQYFVVSSDGTTISRLCNGILLYRFPSALPNGSRTNNALRSGQSYCLLDCIFHEVGACDAPSSYRKYRFGMVPVYNHDQEGPNQCLIIQQTGLHTGNLLCFAINDGGLAFVDGKIEKVDLKYLGPSNPAHTFADCYSKVMFQYIVRHSPLQVEHLFASIGP
ncbi:hypothetical protein ACH5RR_038239 [Cinchona calisaya]|uniref:Snurportin-1 n=1 Tax=Cinchona calisaya TaxID=153742 RepID=A0ABD2XUQ9_9GENT